MTTKGLVIAEMEKAYEWLLEEFSIDGAAARIIRNVLEYADRMGGRRTVRLPDRDVGWNDWTF